MDSVVATEPGERAEGWRPVGVKPTTFTSVMDAVPLDDDLPSVSRVGVDEFRPRDAVVRMPRSRAAASLSIAPAPALELLASDVVVSSRTGPVAVAVVLRVGVSGLAKHPSCPDPRNYPDLDPAAAVGQRMAS